MQTVPAIGASPLIERRRLRVSGTVQGVGFRPFVHALAGRHGLGGFVLNDGRGVVVEVEGDPGALDAFATRLERDAPALARVESVSVAAVAPRGERAFAIARSDARGAGAAVPPDVATCVDCLGELWDPADRRHRYPFVNCTACGPRLTIVERTPYDRPNTTMAGFELCADCRGEYQDPSDRRFHAEPIACPACGPRLSMPLERAVELLRDGRIVAVKGLGGYHLACDASSEAAVARLRARKQREEKPFAVMAADPWAPGPPPALKADPRALGELEPAHEALLRARERPIVLLPRRADAPVAASVAPGGPWLGVMLPYTPLHHLLLADAGRPLVMTSGNRSDEPIAFTDDDARERLGGIADAFLAHDRPIHRRCEDSVLRARSDDAAAAGGRSPARRSSGAAQGAFFVRRSRGYAPAGLPLPVATRRPIVAAGAELKATFCVARGREAYLSSHLGDLDSELAFRAFRTDLALYLEMLRVEPELVACDLHPDYLSTRWAERAVGEPLRVQHHHAHAAACLAEHGETGPALAVVLDGTGFGPDGTLWGGELLRADLSGFERLAHLEPVPLPGGEAAIREPWRSAAAYLERAGRPVPFAGWARVRESLKVNAPRSSGAGRLFDAVAALLGVRERVTYEGQAAIELEWLAGASAAAPYPCRVSGGLIAGADLVRAAHDDLAAGRPRAEIAAAFHEGVAAAAAAACAQAAEPRTVALSGGCFQNARLLRTLSGRLEALGFRVLAHRRVPANDGSISYGQAAVAAARAGTLGEDAGAA